MTTSLLQIENESYGTIRPKRVIRPGERPLHALRERGVEYVEVRLMDLDPFKPLGIDAGTMRVIDLFLLHCLLSESPPDSNEEIARMYRNQHLTAARGREPDLRLERRDGEIALFDWALEIIDQCKPIAAAVDAAQGRHSLRARRLPTRARPLIAPQRLPSARVLEQWRALRPVVHGLRASAVAGHPRGAAATAVR